MEAQESERIQKAVYLLGAYTHGRYDIMGGLAGDARAQQRVQIMSILQGKKVARAQAGVTAIRAMFYDLAGVAGTGDCNAQRETAFVAWAKSQAGVTE